MPTLRWPLAWVERFTLPRFRYGWATSPPVGEYGFSYGFNLQPGSGAVFGQATYAPSPVAFGNDTLDEHTTITVTHTPAPYPKL